MSNQAGRLSRKRPAIPESPRGADFWFFGTPEGSRRERRRSTAPGVGAADTPKPGPGRLPHGSDFDKS